MIVRAGLVTTAQVVTIMISALAPRSRSGSGSRVRGIERLVRKSRQNLPPGYLQVTSRERPVSSLIIDLAPSGALPPPKRAPYDYRRPAGLPRAGHREDQLRAVPDLGRGAVDPQRARAVPRQPGVRPGQPGQRKGIHQR